MSLSCGQLKGRLLSPGSGMEEQRGAEFSESGMVCRGRWGNPLALQTSAIGPPQAAVDQVSQGSHSVRAQAIDDSRHR